jgi:F0F1-type ATP synthase membrane subunit b/b'
VGNAVAERETLEQLAGDEAALERDIARARDDAAAIVEGARREAEAIASETRREAEREAERLRAEAAEALDRAFAAAQAGVAADATELRRRAGAQRERAVARVLAAVLPPLQPCSAGRRKSGGWPGRT